MTRWTHKDVTTTNEDTKQEKNTQGYGGMKRTKQDSRQI